MPQMRVFTIRFCPNCGSKLTRSCASAVIFGYGLQRWCSKCELFWCVQEAPFPGELRLLGSKHELRVTH